MSDDIIAKARNFAIMAHNSIDQKRKYTNEPYYIHCEKVAYLVSIVTNDENMIAAAWLHDVIEDVAPQNLDMFGMSALLKEFGEDITYLVWELTDKSLPSDGNRAQRKEIDRKLIACASDRAKVIKLADLIDNAESIIKHDKNFARVYLEEMYLLMKHLKNDRNYAQEALYILAENIMYRGYLEVDLPLPYFDMNEHTNNGDINL